MEEVPAPSTITEILRRHERLGTPDGEGRQRRYRRFEHEAPNQLWQIDFKSPVQTPRGVCHTLTVLDDHSRYNLSRGQGHKGCSARPHQRLPTLRVADPHQWRQRRALGFPAGAHAWDIQALSLTDPAGHQSQPQPSLPPTNERQKRTFPSLWDGKFRGFGRSGKVSNALMWFDIALRPASQRAEGAYDQFFCHRRIGKFDLRKAEK
jgi:hypothetical protein